MKYIFFIFGYGIPQDIMSDTNYQRYLYAAFNKMYETVIKKEHDDPLIICSGGNTDLFHPFQRTEGEEMVRFLKQCARRSFVQKKTKYWEFVAEKKALSTLENYLNSMAIVEKKNFARARIMIFCEYTRKKRVQQLAPAIIGDRYEYQVVPIDFDISVNRYIRPEFIAKKERAELQHALWALQSAENLEKHHDLFQEKIDFLRLIEPDQRAEALKKWWEDRLDQFMRQES